MREGDGVSSIDKELWEYFSTLYKNSNKGIKGRGKDRRIFAVSKDHPEMEKSLRSASSSSSAESQVFDGGRRDETSSNSSLDFAEREYSFDTVPGKC